MYEALKRTTEASKDLLEEMENQVANLEKLTNGAVGKLEAAEKTTEHNKQELCEIKQQLNIISEQRHQISDQRTTGPVSLT